MNKVRKYKIEFEGLPKALREQLIKDYAYLVILVARKIHSKMPSSVEIEDMISDGFIGLMDAIDKFDPSRSNKFKTYAEWRIRGEILDELRKQDVLPRSVRDKLKAIDKAAIDLERETQSMPEHVDIARKLSLSTEAYFKMLGSVFGNMGKRVDLENQLLDAALTAAREVENQPAPIEVLCMLSNKKILVKALESLPEKEKTVINLHFMDGLNLKEIGRVLRVSESRVSQIKHQALKKMRRKMKEDFFEP